MKKTLIVMFSVLVFFTSCKTKENLPDNFIEQPHVDENYYVEEAVNLTLEASELAASDEIVGMYTGDDEVLSIVGEIGKFDFSEPESMQIVKIDTEKIKQYLLSLFPDETANVDVEKLIELNKIKISAFAQTYNATYGVKYIAALSVLGGVGEGYIKPANYDGDFVIYLKYPGEFSSIVEFREIGENVISSTQQFVKNPAENGVEIEDFMEEIFGAIGEDSISAVTVEREE